MFQHVALRPLVAFILTQATAAFPINASIALHEDSTRTSVELHLGHPLPDLRVRRTLAAMLDLHWCVHEQCESLLQLWAPTLAEDFTVVNLESTPTSSRDTISPVVAKWVIPCLKRPWVLDTTADFRVYALVSVYNEGMAKLAQVEVSLPLHITSEDNHHSRPKFLKVDDFRHGDAHLWLATSFIIEGHATDIPLTIQCSRCESLYDIHEQDVLSINRIANDFLQSIRFDGREVEKASLEVTNAILDSRRGRLRRRADFVHRLNLWQESRCAYNESEVPYTGLRLVIGAGPAEVASDSSVDPHAWIVSEVNTFDVTDSADWAIFLQFLECPRDGTTLKLAIYQLFAEHVLEHLDYADAHFALTQVARVFAAHSSPLLSTPSFRIAVPDSWAGGDHSVNNSSSMNSFAADVRDGHRVRYTAWSLCALLDAAGLDGMLLEWNYPQSASERVKSAFPIPSDEILEHDGWTSRVHLLNDGENDRPVLRSVHGGEARGAVSLVVDAFLPGTQSKSMHGDTCSALLSAVAQTKDPGVWTYPNSNTYSSQNIHDGLAQADSGIVIEEEFGPNLDSVLNRVCIDSEITMRQPECIAWSALAAFRLSSSAVAKTISRLALGNNVSFGDEDVLENQLQAEDMNLQLAALLQSLGQHSLALQAAQRALIYGVGPLRKRALSNLAHISDNRQTVRVPYLVASPLAWQVFRPEESIEIAVNLQTFDEMHREAIPYRRQTSSIFNRFSRTALGTCFTLHKFQLKNGAESLPSMRSCSYLAGQSSFNPESPIVALTGLDHGQYELRVRVWWLPASVAASKMQRVPFCIKSADPANLECGKDWAATASREHSNARERPVQEDVAKPPIYFFTIVLNGMPFLQHHAKVFAEAAQQLGVPWEWHVVEGVAVGRADKSNPYSSRPLGEIVRSDGCSTDGTFEYLNDLQGNFSFKDNVVVNRNFLGRSYSSLNDLFRRSKSSKDSAAEARCFWMDKLEMVNTAIMSISHPGVLFQVDVDELWSPDAIASAYKTIEHEHYQCLRVHCHFFVAPDLVTTSRHGYGHSDAYEWTRVWKFEPGATFVSHAPPILITRNSKVDIWELHGAGEPLPENVSQIETQGAPGSLSTVAVPCLGPEATSKRGIAFSHYAYALREQVEFKAKFYGHSFMSPNETVKSWLAMQHAPRPLRAADYLPWVNASERFRETYVDVVSKSPIASNIPVVPIPAPAGTSPKIANISSASPISQRLVVVLDMVIFQRLSGGIARVWRGLLPHLMRELESSCRVKPLMVLLFRDGTPHSLARAIEFDLIQEGISVDRREDEVPSMRCDCGSISCCAVGNEAELRANTVQVIWGPPYDAENRDFDQLALASICHNVGARVFISTEYSTTIQAPLAPASFGRPPKQVLLVHDFTPERFGWQSTEWDAKTEALSAAAAIVTVSHATAAALPKYYPYERATSEQLGGVKVSPNGLDDAFRSCSQEISNPQTPSMNHSNESDSDAKHQRWFGLLPGVPYIMVVGPREGYKNIATLYRALAIVNDVKPCVPWSNTSPHQGVQLLLVGGGSAPRGEEAKLIKELLEDAGGTCRDLSGYNSHAESSANGETASREGKNSRDGTCLVGSCRFVRAVFHAPNLDDKGLREAYRGAALLAYLSLDEGFGLPIVESLACGCPVIASDIAAHRELLRCPSRSDLVHDGDRKQEAGGVENGWNCSAWRDSSYGSNHPGVALVDPTSSGDVASALLAFLNVPGGQGTHLEEVAIAAAESADSPGDSRQDERKARQVVRRQLTTFAQKHFTSWQPLGTTLAKEILMVSE